MLQVAYVLLISDYGAAFLSLDHDEAWFDEELGILTAARLAPPASVAILPLFVTNISPSHQDPADASVTQWDTALVAN